MRHNCLWDVKVKNVENEYLNFGFHFPKDSKILHFHKKGNINYSVLVIASK